MLGTFFPPEIYNKSEPGVFYGGRPNNIIKKIEKEKKVL
jgi:hypothetical protein